MTATSDLTSSASTCRPVTRPPYTDAVAIWTPEPSFSRSVARASRDRQFPVARVMLSKLGTRRLLKALDAPVPGEFRELGSIADITAETLARPTVVKPVQGSNNRGVFPLRPVAPGRWHDLEHDVELSLERVREELSRALVQHSLADRWIGEELLRGTDGATIDDAKFLMFRGRVGAAFVRRNPAHTFTWFDEAWNPIVSGIRQHPRDPSVGPPSQRAELTDLAVRISRALPLPFVRVDMYSTSRGPVVGELTPYPGWAHDVDTELDIKLGILYERAESELIADGMDWNRVTDAPEVPRLIEEFASRSRATR